MSKTKNFVLQIEKVLGPGTPLTFTQRLRLEVHLETLVKSVELLLASRVPEFDLWTREQTGYVVGRNEMVILKSAFAQVTEEA